MRRFAVACIVIGLVSAVQAQRESAAPVFFRVNVEGDVVKGAPYSAEIVNEMSQTLGDGNRIFRRTTSRVYRDNEGRTRREEDRPSGGPAVTISDPVAGFAWSLDAERRTARQTSSMARFYQGTLGTNGELERLNVAINGVLTTARIEGGRGGPPAGSTQNIEERLAPRTIEGLRVEGVRRTQTIPAGAIGNERPIVAVTEEWTSPELKTLVLSEHSDPRTGTSSYKLVGVSRAEPAVWLFQVPSDYTIVEVGQRGGGRGGPPPPR